MDVNIRTGAMLTPYANKDFTSPQAVSSKESTPTTVGDSIQISAQKKETEPKTGDKVKVTIIPHDPLTSKPGVIEVEKAKVGSTLANEKAYSINASNPKAIPDLEGNYLYELGTAQFDQVNSFNTVSQTVDMMESAKGSPVKWAFKNPKLGVNPHKREGMNAYYSRNEASVNFFYFKSEPLGKTVQTSQSSDIVAHEVGHAVLDGIRPGYLGWDVETMSVHEAFGDMSSMMYALKDEGIRNTVLGQNGGDFSKHSLISKLGEEFGKAVVLADSNPNNDNRDYLRSMINDFKYVDPSTLPEKTDPDQLAGECHSFSRVLSGALYDMVGDFYDKNKAGRMSPEEALKVANDDFSHLMLKTAELAPTTTCKFKDFALAMLKCDKQEFGGVHSDMIKDSFLNRKIISDKDISELNAHMNNIPDFSVNSKMSAPKIAESFVSSFGSKLNIPDGTIFSMDESSENIYGGKSVNLTCSEELPLAGSHFGKYEGYFVDAKGGLRLDFDKNGKLIDYVFDAIDVGKKANIFEGVKDAINNDLVNDGSISRKNEDPSKNIVEIRDMGDGRKKLERLPIIVM